LDLSGANTNAAVSYRSISTKHFASTIPKPGIRFPPSNHRTRKYFPVGLATRLHAPSRGRPDSQVCGRLFRQAEKWQAQGYSLELSRSGDCQTSPNRAGDESPSLPLLLQEFFQSELSTASLRPDWRLRGDTILEAWASEVLLEGRTV